MSAARATADRDGLPLDASGFAPCAAAVLDVEGTSMNVVVALRTWRGVGAVRYGGAPALLVGDLDTVDGDAIESVDLDAGLRVCLVQHAGAGDAERIAVADATGTLL